MIPPFPTLAEQLAHGPPTREADPPLVVLRECAGSAAPGRALPPTAVTASVGESGFDGLVRVVRSTPGDVLLVSDRELLTPRVVAALAVRSRDRFGVYERLPGSSRRPLAAGRATAAGYRLSSGRARPGPSRRSCPGPRRSLPVGDRRGSGLLSALRVAPPPRLRPPPTPPRRTGGASLRAVPSTRPQARDSEIVLDGSCLAHPLTGTRSKRSN